jgi:hypothetical protein
MDRDPSQVRRTEGAGDGEPPSKRRAQAGGFAAALRERCPISYDGTLRKCMDFWRKKTRDYAVALVSGRRHVEPAQFPGIVRLHLLRADFASGIAEWQPYQSAVFEMFVNANIINILGTDSDMCLESVMRDGGWTDVPDEMLVLASRGSGKSTLLAVAVAAFLKDIPGYSAMVYSGIKEKSVDLLNSIWAAFEGMRMRDEDFKNSVATNKTKDTITICVNGTDMRQIHCSSSFGMVSPHRTQTQHERVRRNERGRPQRLSRSVCR